MRACNSYMNAPATEGPPRVMLVMVSSISHDPIPGRSALRRLAVSDLVRHVSFRSANDPRSALCHRSPPAQSVARFVTRILSVFGVAGEADPLGFGGGAEGSGGNRQDVLAPYLDSICNFRRARRSSSLACYPLSCAACALCTRVPPDLTPLGVPQLCRLTLCIPFRCAGTRSARSCAPRRRPARCCARATSSAMRRSLSSG